MCILTCLFVQAQETTDLFTYENIEPSPGKCLADHHREEIKETLDRNSAKLRQAGKLTSHRSNAQPLFQWPLAQSPGINYPGYYVISNFVDQNPDEDETLDYNCEARTYDGHRGIDIRIEPYRWNKMNTNQVRIVAAAPGEIIHKHDDEFDMSCEFGGSWNAVYLEHSDGSRTWYGHMKSGSLTNKAEGENVVAGEYLGLVGSSGSSTSPHLHFEVYDSDGDLVDPFSGPCNDMNNNSWWADQLPYYHSGINRLITHGADPENFDCPLQSVINEKYYFCPGEQVGFAAYYRDDLTANSSEFRLYDPDGVLSPVLSETYSRAGNYYSKAPYARYTRTLPEDAKAGTWTFEVEYTSTTYGSVTYQQDFRIGYPCTPTYSFAFPQHNVPAYYVVSNAIQSVSDVPQGVHIWYDAKNVITLAPGFQAKSGGKFVAKIDGCDN